MKYLTSGFGKCRMCVCGTKGAAELLQHHELIRCRDKLSEDCQRLFL